MGHRNHIPITIVGLSYIVVAGVYLVQILMNNYLNLFTLSFIVPETLWILFGIAIIYQKRAAIILSLISFPLNFVVVSLPILPIPYYLYSIKYFMEPFFYIPLHNICLVLFQKYDIFFIIISIPFLWGTYAIHSICLLPYLFKKSERVHGPKKAAIKFRFPEVVDIYQKNAFQVLGISPKKATIRLAMKRKNELSALIKTDLLPKDHVQDHYSIPWPSTKPITEIDINNAYSRLQDNLKSIKEEAFWFHFEKDDFDEPFGQLLEGDFEKARELWEAKSD